MQMLFLFDATDTDLMTKCTTLRGSAALLQSDDVVVPVPECPTTIHVMPCRVAGISEPADS